MTRNTPSASSSNPSGTQALLAIAVALLLVAFALRALDIANVPPGLTHDEVSELDVAQQVRNGEWRLLYTRGYGVEPGYYTLLAVSQMIWGENPIGMRLPTIFAGIIGLACTYTLAARLFNKTVGLVALGAAGVSWWSIIMARVIEREMLEVPLYALALYGFWRGFERVAFNHEGTKSQRRPGVLAPSWPVPFVLGGLALGAAHYVHTIPRGLFVASVLFGLYLLLFHRSLFTRAWRGILLFAIVAEVVGLPIWTPAAQKSDVDRLPLYIAGESGTASEIVTRLASSLPWVLGQFAFTGDDFWNFNIAHRPIFESLGAALFGLGLLVAIARGRRPAHAFALITLIVSLLPSIFLDPHFPFARMISAQVIAFAFVGLGVEAIDAGLRHVAADRARRALMAVLLGGVLAVNLIWTAGDLFVTWPALPSTRSTYNAQLRELGRYLDAQAQPPPLSQCTLWIIFPFDPKYHWSVAQSALPYLMRRRDIGVRWHDCRYSLVVPTPGQFVFAHSDLQPLSDFLGRPLRRWLEGGLPIPGAPGALQVDARPMLAQSLAEWRRLPVSWPPEVGETAAPSLPIDFGGVVELIGYRIRPGPFKPGDSIRVVSHWRVTAPVEDELVVFTHLYRTPDEVMAQQDQLDVSTPHLKTGDIFIQVHEFITVPSDTPPGLYWIGMGVYRREGGERIPIIVGNRLVGDRIWLDQIEVAP